MAKKENENDVLVIAYYRTAEAAESAAEKIKQWDKENDEVELGAIGVITLDEDGFLQVQEMGQRNTKRGALWGTAIGAGLGFLTAGIAFIPGMLIGAAIGGGVGTIDHKSLGMEDQDVSSLKANLAEGGVALGVMCDSFEVEATRAKMIEDGGQVNYWEVPENTSAAISAALAAQDEAVAAVDEALVDARDDVSARTQEFTAELPDVAVEKYEAVAALATAGGLSSADAASLNNAGVEKASALLQQGATPQGRAALAEASGVSEESILAALKQLDLMRIKGVGVVYARLLRAAGVETVPDLARRNPENLAASLAEVNEATGITESVPTAEQVADWVNQAENLPRIINY